MPIAGKKRYPPSRIDRQWRQSFHFDPGELDSPVASKVWLEAGYVDIIGHPMRTYYKFHYGKTTAEEFPQDSLIRIIEKSRQVQIPLEYNAKLPCKDTFLRLLLSLKAPFLIGTDSHSLEEFKRSSHEKLYREIEKERGSAR